MRSGVAAPQQILAGFAPCLRYCSDVAHRRPTKLCTMFGRLVASTLCIHFGGSCPLSDGILPGAKLSLHPSLAFSYIGSVTARHSSSGRQANCGVVQEMQLGNLELLQRAPPIFGWATTTFGIGPHSSW